MGALLLLCLSACEAPVPGAELDAEFASGHQPIIGGIDAVGDDAVVFLNTPAGNCTGTLIAPRVVLTAAHCIYDAIDSGLSNVGTASVGQDVTGANAEQTANVVDMFAHRFYDPGVLRQFDIGLVRLEADPFAPAITPMAFNLEALDENGGLVGASVRVVGYGVTDGDTRDGDGTRLQLPSEPILSVTAEHVVFGDENSNICFGDSGGPTFIDFSGTERVVAVSSFTVNSCKSQSFVTRTDVYADVLREVVAAWDGPCQQGDGCDMMLDCGEFPDPDCDGCGLNGICQPGCAKVDLDCAKAGLDGESCENNDGCESRNCVQAVDDQRVKYCSESCDPADANSCGTPLAICTDAGDGTFFCAYDGPTPGAQGWPCTASDECRSNICDQAAGICASQCGDGFPSCEDGFECLTAGENFDICTRSGGGCGCHTDGGNGAAGTGLLLVLVGLFIRRRRR